MSSASVQTEIFLSKSFSSVNPGISAVAFLFDSASLQNSGTPWGAKPANATIAPLHDRMPVIVKDEHCERWLYDNDPRSEIFTWALEHPSEDPLKIYPVSPMINNARVGDPLCVQPYRIS